MYRRDHITLGDDLRFDLEFELLGATGHSDHDFGTQSTIHDSALFSPYSADSLSQDTDRSMQELMIPPSGSSVGGEAFGLGYGGSSVSGQGDRGSRFESGLFRRDEEDTGLLEDPGFGFDMEGNLIEGTADERASILRSVRTPSIALGELSADRARSISQRGSGRPGIEDAVSLPPAPKSVFRVTLNPADHARQRRPATRLQRLRPLSFVVVLRVEGVVVTPASD